MMSHTNLKSKIKKIKIEMMMMMNLNLPHVPILFYSESGLNYGVSKIFKIFKKYQ